MNNYLKNTILLSLLCFCTQANRAQSKEGVTEFVVETRQSEIQIQPTMYGVFFEDINFGADGGLYAELIKNRSFEFDYPFSGWSPFGSVSIETKNPCFDRNPHYARLTYSKELTGTGLENEGFRGIGIKEGEKYDLSFFARTKEQSSMTVKIELVNDKNEIYETKELKIAGKNWAKYEITLEPLLTNEKSKIRFTLLTQGEADFDHLSLFPQKTFMNRKNGMRADLAQSLKELHPGVFRFPGGCIVEGNNLATRYQWKHTIGPVENRPGILNRWNYTFYYKKFNDYYQSFGLGFYEYFQLSEDIGAEPLPVLNCGLSCQYENEDPKENCPVSELQPYIDDALDLIEFANGSETSKWGKIRAEMGHPQPFNLKMIAIGNEQWGTLYTERLEPFVKAIRSKYPDIKIIGSSGPSPDGQDFDYLWKEMARLDVDLVDEHYYRSPEWFLQNAARYDKYDRKGPKVFAGEYACHTQKKDNNFLSALSEAAFMTGLERNADVVEMCTYAPLFAHTDAWQWKPDLIWFNNLSLVKTPNYYVQQLYGRYPGTHVLSLTADGLPVTGQSGLYASAVVDKQANTIILKIVNTGVVEQKIGLNLKGLESGEYPCTLTELSTNDLNSANTMENPSSLIPKKTKKKMTLPATTVNIPSCSFSVYCIEL